MGDYNRITVLYLLTFNYVRIFIYICGAQKYTLKALFIYVF